ncbi:MAG TPA: hypothetical protein VKZ97_06940 [Flavobacteriaceae bacterium]|nr:hypothetical protein [Flavobacteriaceae bacterium]
MHKLSFTALFFLAFLVCKAQQPITTERDSTKAQDSIKKEIFLNHLGNGFFPTKYFDFDLRYLIKYNQYEGLRTGLGGTTNNNLSEVYRFNTYVVYGFKDHRFKYGLGAWARLHEATNTWLKIGYTDDLLETGSAVFLTDSRVFQFFEPRLLNIDLFYKHITQSIALQHDITPRLHTETQLSVSNIQPAFNYVYASSEGIITEFELSKATLALQWNPYSKEQDGHTIFSLQISQALKDVLKSDYGFTKVDFKTQYIKPWKNNSKTEVTLTSGIVNGSAPLTHLYHAYPNNITKETILQRFSVAGLTSFETMYFNEFFSDKFSTVQFKHFLKPFKISTRYQPQLVLVSKFAVGTMDNTERHLGIDFNTLDKGYFESGLELNKLFFGFGLSAAYRYGGYHLPKLEDNIALKFTFNITL